MRFDEIQCVTVSVGANKALKHLKTLNLFFLDLIVCVYTPLFG